MQLNAIAKAHTNIALIKYWGKRNEDLILPMNNSISLTLDKFYTVTSVSFHPDLKEDVFYLNGVKTGENETAKISSFLDTIRTLAQKDVYAHIESVNHVPTAAGFASSASGFAALGAAACKAIGLNVDKKTLSQIVRRGSGSACRSVYGGFVEWEKGGRVDGSDSYAVPLFPDTHWELAVLSVLVEDAKKKVSSRQGMKSAVETSPFYKGWLDSIEEDLLITKQALAKQDFILLGETLERNALKMHAINLGANPPFWYWTGGTLAVMERVQTLRKSRGIPVYFTIDAGPNVKVFCLPEHEKEISDQLKALPEVQDLFVCRPGKGVAIVDSMD